MNLVLATVIRAIMLVVGALTGQQGWDNEETIQAVVGGALALGGLVWALWEKFRLRQVGIRKMPRKPKVPVTTERRNV